MAVHSKSSQARRASAAAQSSAGRRAKGAHHPYRHPTNLRPGGPINGEAAGALLQDGGLLQQLAPAADRSGTGGGRPRKRGRLDALFPLDAAGATPPKKQKRVTGEYPIRSRPVPSSTATTTTAAVTAKVKPVLGEEKDKDKDRRGREQQRRTKAAQPPPSESLAPPKVPATKHAATTTTTKPLPIATTTLKAPPPANRSTSRPTSIKAEESNGLLDPSSGGGVNGVNGVNKDAATATTRTIDRRALRSQDGGSRSRSELSLYFPNYDELISNEPKKTELLTADTRIFVTEDPPRSPKTVGKTFVLHSPARLPPAKMQPPKRKPQQGAVAAAAGGNRRALDPLHHFQTLDFSTTLAKLPRAAVDPLPPEFFAVAHRRSERQEKQLRNIEKERAQHEKVQLERLYDGLRGPDWLRVMGISGVTEGERKSWDGKRTFFVKEVGALLEKFRIWKEEEKRRKMEKEEKDLHDSDEENEAEEDEEDEVAEEEDDEVEEEAEDVDEEEEEDDGDEEGEELEGEEEVEDSDAASDGPEDIEIPDSDAAPSSPPHLSVKAARGRRVRSPLSVDVDALAAQQLHTEALLSAKHPPAGWGKASSSSSSAVSATAPTTATATATKTKKPTSTKPPSSKSNRGSGTATTTKDKANAKATAKASNVTSTGTRGGGGGGHSSSARGRGGRSSKKASSSTSSSDHHAPAIGAAASVLGEQPTNPPAGDEEDGLHQQPLTSFFRKAHQRSSALATGRRHTGRVQFAFGQPIPDVSRDGPEDGENDFVLPANMATAEAQRASARSRRARKRGASS